MKNVEEIGKNKIEKLLSSEPTTKTPWEILTREGIFSRAIPEADRNKDWKDLLHEQIVYAKTFLSTSVTFGLGIPPLNEEGSLVALSVYNATVDWSSEWGEDWEEQQQINIPSTKAVYQEFWKLLVAEEGGEDDE